MNPPASSPSTTPANVRLSKSSISERHVERVAAAVRQGYLGMGKEVEAFEQEIRAFLGADDREVMCVSTGTSALHLALQACGIGPGDEVLLPTITYVASYQAVSATGATPVSCEVRAGDCLIDLEDAASRITPRTKAVLPVHYASNPAMAGQITDFARAHGLRVIEDAAHAFGCSWNGRRIGAFGDVVCFSFDGIKNITSGEGGAVVTGDAEVAERVKNARLLGVLKDTEKRYAGQRSWDFDVSEQGWRYHMSNINAALGRAQLEDFSPHFAPVRVQRATEYQELLGGSDNVRLLPITYGTVIPHIFPVFFPGGHRDAVRAELTARGIESGFHYKPNHLLSYYGGGTTRFPVAERLYEEMLTLPMHADLTADEVRRVVDAVRSVTG